MRLTSHNLRSSLIEKLPARQLLLDQVPGFNLCSTQITYRCSFNTMKSKSMTCSWSNSHSIQKTKWRPSKTISSIKLAYSWSKSAVTMLLLMANSSKKPWIKLILSWKQYYRLSWLRGQLLTVWLWTILLRLQQPVTMMIYALASQRPAAISLHLNTTTMRSQLKSSALTVQWTALIQSNSTSTRPGTLEHQMIDPMTI